MATTAAAEVKVVNGAELGATFSRHGRYNHQLGAGLAKHAGSRMFKPFLEYGLALEDIAGTLAQDAITNQERGHMIALADRMKLEGGLVPRALAACPRQQEEQHC